MIVLRMKKIQAYPSPSMSVLPIILLVVLLFFTIKSFGSDALSGASQVCLLVSTAVCSAIGMIGYGIKWKDIEHAIVNNIAGVSSAIIILLIIGALSAVWMLSGVVPTLIYYGVQLIHPSLFLASCCVICAIVSVMTGSSWTTIATIGIALMGIGEAQGFNEGWIAGAIISGAYFGYKVSPLSDTTILASSVTDTPLFTHIKYLMITTVPSIIISLVIFLVAGFSHESGNTVEMAAFSEGLAERFNISLWLLLVPVVTGILIAKKVPSIITLFISAAMALVFMLVFQMDNVIELAGGQTDAQSIFKATLQTLFTSSNLQAETSQLTELIATMGMGGMMNTIWLIVCAMCLGGAMTACGMLASITGVFVKFTRRLTGMVASTVGSGIFLNLATADQYISIILVGNMFRDIYKNNGYESRLLSRTTEDAVTVTSVLVPWNTCGMTQSTILGVPTLAYLLYAFFNYISPLMSILVAALGFRIFRVKKEE